MGLASLCFVAYKAAVIPITHDETATVVWYSTFSNWEIMMYPDSWPNNHILNTLLAKLSMNMFSDHQFFVRLPNVLGFLLYLIAIYKLARHFTLYNNTLVFSSILLLFLSNLYLIDFFSLARGYGLSIAFCSLSIAYFIDGFIKNKTLFIWMAILFSMLGAYANFTTLIFFASASLLAFLYFISRDKYTIKQKIGLLFIQFVISTLFGLLIVVPIIKMSENDQFQYWTNDGFVKQTLVSIIETFKYGGHPFRGIDPITLIWSFIGLLGLSIVGYFFRKRLFLVNKDNNLFLLGIYFIISCSLISILQSLILGSPNLTYRTALFLFPMVILCLISIITYFIKTNILLNLISVLILIVSLNHIVKYHSIDDVREWSFNKHTLTVIDDINKLEENNSKEVSLKTDWLFHPSFNFYDYTNRAGKINVLKYDKKVSLNTDAKYYYIYKKDLNTISSAYKVINTYENGEHLLLVRN